MKNQTFPALPFLTDIFWHHHHVYVDKKESSARECSVWGHITVERCFIGHIFSLLLSVIAGNNGIPYVQHIFPTYWILFRTNLQLRKPTTQHSCPDPVVHGSSPATSLPNWSSVADGHSRDPCSSDGRTQRGRVRDSLCRLSCKNHVRGNSLRPPSLLHSHKNALVKKTLILLLVS